MLAAEDPQYVQAALQSRYGARLCVVPSRWTHRQLDDVAGRLRAEMGRWMIYTCGHSTTEDGQALLTADLSRVLPAFAELNTAVWRSALDIWNAAGRRWWGQAGFDTAEAAKVGDKRFAAAEWHGNPLYRTLKEVYLLASDWLLKHREVAEMGDAERLRLDFHLRQFVDAMSPALLLASNPVAPTAGLRDRGHQPCRRHA